MAGGAGTERGQDIRLPCGHPLTSLRGDHLQEKPPEIFLASPTQESHIKDRGQRRTPRSLGVGQH